MDTTHAPIDHQKRAAFTLLMDTLCTITDPPGHSLEDAQAVLRDSGERLAMSIDDRDPHQIRVQIHALRQGYSWNLTLGANSFSELVAALSSAGHNAGRP